MNKKCQHDFVSEGIRNAGSNFIPKLILTLYCQNCGEVRQTDLTGMLIEKDKQNEGK